MCYAGGPRCSSHAKAALKSALKTGDETKIAKARKDYLLTPDGIAHVAKTDPQKAQVLSERREKMKPSRPVKVFRNGSMAPPSHTGELAEITERLDEHVPEGRRKRGGSLCFAPSLAGVTRWADANLSLGIHEDPQTYEVALDPHATWVYPIQAWEDFCYGAISGEDYWKSGVPLGQWQDQGHDGSQWEVLVDPEKVDKPRRVSAKRLLSAAPESRADQLKMVLKRYRIQ